MQVGTERKLLNIGRAKPPMLSVTIAPRSSSGYLVAGIVVGALMGFVAGSVLTILLGEKSLLLVQHLWGRLTGVQDDSERVHFELLLQ